KLAGMSTELDKLDKDVRIEARPEAIEPMPIADFPAMRSSRSRGAVKAAVWIAVLAMIGIGGYFIRARRAASAPQVRYETAKADRGTIAAKVTATGNLAALLTVQVGAQVSGRVQQLFVDYNSAVKKGEPIAKLDPLLFEAAVAQTSATVASLESSI